MRRRRKKHFLKACVATVLLIAAISAVIYHCFPAVYMPIRYEKTVVAQARHHRLDEALVYAVIYCESGFDEQAVSHAGACGLMQVMPQTAQELAQRHGIAYTVLDDLFVPEVNVALGCAFLSELIAHFQEVPTALAAYNAGRARVKGWLKEAQYSHDGKTLHDIPYKETKEYVRKVMAAYEKYQKVCA